MSAWKLGSKGRAQMAGGKEMTATTPCPLPTRGMNVHHLVLSPDRSEKSRAGISDGKFGVPQQFECDRPKPNPAHPPPPPLDFRCARVWGTREEGGRISGASEGDKETRPSTSEAATAALLSR